MDEQPVRRRRKRRRRRRRGGGGAATADQPAAAPAALPDWQWRTFPVAFAFVLGALAMALLVALAPRAFPVWLSIALFGVAFGLAHILGRRWLATRRRRR